MIILGIDPGSTGALLALRRETDEVLGWWPLPWVVGEGVQVRALIDVLEAVRAYGPYRIVLESSGYQIGASGGSGARTAYSTGHTLGVLQGVTAALHLPVVLVRPQVWQADLHLAAPRGAAPPRPADDATQAQRREHARQVSGRRAAARKAGQARQLAYVQGRWPSLVLTQGRARKPHDGAVAAACLAAWGAR